MSVFGITDIFLVIPAVTTIDTLAILLRRGTDIGALDPGGDTGVYITNRQSTASICHHPPDMALIDHMRGKTDDQIGRRLVLLQPRLNDAQFTGGKPEFDLRKGEGNLIDLVQVINGLEIAGIVPPEVWIPLGPNQFDHGRDPFIILNGLPSLIQPALNSGPSVIPSTICITAFADGACNRGQLLANDTARGGKGIGCTWHFGCMAESTGSATNLLQQN